jgi:FKBP-type peptidyl-prolyl cis-trans isomerase FklB
MIMKMTLILIVALGVAFLTPQVSAQETEVFKTHKDKISYVAGVEMATTLKMQGMEFNMDLFIKGLQDAFSGGKLLLSDDEIRKASSMFHAELRQKQNETREKLAKAARVEAEDNKKKGEAFLAENRTKEGVVTLPSGLQYKILKAGDGRKPTDADTVEVNYRGTLIDGTQFDSSQAGQPSILKVTAVISGWREALKLMPIGSKWQLFIPPQLAYGGRRASPVIGPNETLIFELELVGIK